jgi:predicted HTH domain antitoxin
MEDNKGMKIELDLELPDELIDKKLEQELVSLAKEDIVLRLFEERRIAGGVAARLLKVTRRKFMELCERRGVALTEYTAEDLGEDLAVMDRLRGEEPGESAD